MNVMTDLIREGQQTGEIRGGDVGGLAHLACASGASSIRRG
jgi:hypothetical protein